jgi:hypothetical protein
MSHDNDDHIDNIDKLKKLDIVQATQSLRKREYFRHGRIAGLYPHSGKGMTYVVMSVDNPNAPLAIFDGDVWHLLDMVDTDILATMHLAWIRRVIGTNDSYSEFPIERERSMNALLERLTN